MILTSLFYKQKRYGLNNYIFNIYKLRTMYKDSEQVEIQIKTILEFICLRKKLEV